MSHSEEWRNEWPEDRRIAGSEVLDLRNGVWSCGEAHLAGQASKVTGCWEPTRSLRQPSQGEGESAMPASQVGGLRKASGW